MKTENIKIYVVSHKKSDIKLPENYTLFQAGAKRNGAFCENNDAVGDDNISAKNPYYCELTATYWIWKNDKTSDIVGLMHYRRFLTTHRFSKSPKNYLNGKEICGFLENYDFIVPPLYKNKPSVTAMLCDTVRKKDVELLRMSIERIQPSYIDTFDKVFNGKYTYFCNMFVTRKSEWDKYCEWLFSILFDMERYVDMTGYSNEEKRLYGFLAERLLTVYLIHNNKKVKRVHMIRPKKFILSRVLARLKRIRNK